MRLAIMANEFFDPALGPMGGFGWATREVADTFEERPELGVDVVMFSGRQLPRHVARNSRTPTIGRPRRNLRDVAELRRWAPDLILTIDYRPSYRRTLALFPRTPLILWVRDPRTDYDCRRINSLRIPGEPDTPPQGVATINCKSFASFLRVRSCAGGRTAVASPTHYLEEKVYETYGFTPREWTFLPNPVGLPGSSAPKSQEPSVVFLGRLDPIKRPWLFVELARRFPDVRFIMLGQNHFTGPGAWNPSELPANVELRGHVDGPEKTRVISEAWALINTSIHESLATSFLEALACETPLIAAVDPDNIVSRFGYYVGRWDGSGMDSVPYFADALGRVLDDDAGRARRGAQGSAWASATHTRQAFVNAFAALVADLDVAAGTSPTGAPSFERRS